MPESDRYIPGVPCWIDTSQPDPQAAAEFYGGLFGWEFENVMAPDSPGEYHIGRIRGQDVGAVGSIPEGMPAQAMWNTYIWVESADETASKVTDAGGSVLMEPFDVPGSGPDGACSPTPRVRRSAHGRRGAPGRAGRERARGVELQRPQHPRPEGAKAFYGAVFGWGVLEMDGGFAAWTLAGIRRPPDASAIRACGSG